MGKNNSLSYIMTQIFFVIIWLLIYFKLAKTIFFWKTLFKPNLWLFSTFFGPVWDFYNPISWSMHKIWSFGQFWSTETLFEKIFFENVLKGPFQPLCIVHFLFGYVVLYTTPMNLALEQAERGLPSNGVFTSVINKGH